LKDTKIRSIWESEEAKRIRNLKRDLNSECGKCDVIEYCSFCPGISYLEEGDYNACTKQFRELAEIRSNLYEKGGEKNVDRSKI
jgi:radical SAM protein with 4Fe4S-binding SPASM domain